MYASCDFCNKNTEHMHIIAVPNQLNNLKSSLDGFPPYTHNNFYICSICAVEFIDTMLHSYNFGKLSGGLLEEFFRLKNPKVTKTGIPAKFQSATKRTASFLNSKPNFEMDSEI